MVSPGEHCRSTMAFKHMEALLSTVPMCAHYCSKTDEEMPSTYQKEWVFSALNPPKVVTVSGFNAPPPSTVSWDMWALIWKGWWLWQREEWTDRWNQYVCMPESLSDNTCVYVLKWEITYSGSMFVHMQRSLCSTLRKNSVTLYHAEQFIFWPQHDQQERNFCEGKLQRISY